MKKSVLIIFTIILFSSSSFSQIGYIEQYSDINILATNNLLETKDKGYMLLTTKNNSLYILCVDSLAKKNWDIELKYNEKTTEGITHTKLNDSIYLGLGKSEGNIYVVKFDYKGDTIWTKLYGDSQNNTPCGLVTTSDSSIIISGYNENAYEQGFLLKLNKQGDSVYYKTNDWSTTKNRYNSIIETGDDESVIAVGQLNDDLFIAKYNNTGDTIWTKQYGGNSTDAAYSIVKSNNDFLVVGSSYIPGDLYTESYILKINQLGDTIWTKKFGGDYYHDIAYSIDSLLNDKYIIVGEHNSVFGGDVTNGFYSIINNEGDILSTQIYRPSENAIFYSATLVTDNSYQILGKQGDDLLLLRTNNDGEFNTSLKQIDNFDFLVYPNPAENSITLKNLHSNFVNLEIYNINGQLVLSEKLNSSSPDIDISKLIGGIYLIKFIGSNNYITSRFIKK